MILFADNAPTRMMDVVLLPVALVILGLALWWGGMVVERRFDQKWVKWLAAVPITASLFIGITTFTKMGDPVYRNMIESEGGKTVPGHWIALLTPIIGAAILGAWYYVYSKRDTRYENF